MNILLTNRSMKFRAGSEMWVKTMYEELKKRGYDVDIFTIAENKMIPESYDEKKHYSLALINHNVCLEKVKNWNIDCKVFTSHGVIPALERPCKGANKYVAVSEEVREAMKKRGFESAIIRNPINTCLFKPTINNQELKNILYLDNRQRVVDIVREACKGYNLEIVAGGSQDVRKKIGEADLVITLGRGCYESLASGRNVIVFGHHGADGMMTEESYIESRKCNCSGRRYKEKWDAKRLREELEKYNPAVNLRPLILQSHKVERIVEQYVRVANN